MVALAVLPASPAFGRTLKRRLADLEQRVSRLEANGNQPGAQGPMGAPGPPGPSGAPGAVRAYAIVDPSAGVPRFAVNQGFTAVAKGMRGNLAEGVYCLTGIDPSTPPGTAPVATVEEHFTSAAATTFEIDVDSSAASCPTGTIEIDTFGDGGLSDGIAFSVIVP